MTAVLRVTGRLDTAELERALTVLATRHAALRTVFRRTNAAVTQRVTDPIRVVVPVSDDTDAEFDPAAAPPWRARLQRMADDDHYLVLTLHELICDERSLEILLTDLAGCLPTDCTLPPVPCQYVDYAAWQPAGPLGADPGSAPAPTAAATEQRILIDAGVADALRGLAAAEGCAPDVVLAAVLATTLAAFTGAPDPVVGLLAANRDEPLTVDVVGCFARLYALRADTGGVSWRTLVDRLADRVADLSTRPGTDGAGPLAACCSLRGDRELPSTLGPAELSLQQWPEESADAPLLLRLREQRDGGLAGVLRGDGGTFDAAATARLADLLCTLAAACGHATDEHAAPNRGENRA